MTEAEYRQFIHEAQSYAGQSDDKWNERFIDALAARGLVLHFGELETVGFYIMAPQPFPQGWQYEEIYPTYIVPRRQQS
jgi:hypothetical protein